MENVTLFIPCTFKINIEEMIQDIDHIIEYIIKDRLSSRYQLIFKNTSSKKALFTRKYQITLDMVGIFEFKLECNQKNYELILTVDKITNIPFNVVKDIVLQIEIGIDNNRLTIHSHFTGLNQNV